MNEEVTLEELTGLIKQRLRSGRPKLSLQNPNAGADTRKDMSGY